MIKIVKIILEKKDIEGFINKAYPGAIIKDGLEDDIEILITLKELKQEMIKPEVANTPEVNPPLPPAKGVMDRTRSNFPTF